ncbi:MAG: hypothetical protein HC845_11520 [Akkermansiaceae bacterium]|nr:hypothetical protein [Akkermansiaceae bacterium]
MFSPKIDRPYFEAWLRRAGKQFAVSGRLTQTALTLATQEGGTIEEWRARLRTILEGKEIPSLDLLMCIDGILAGSSKVQKVESQQGSLF